MYTMYTSAQHHNLGSMVLYHATYGDMNQKAQETVLHLKGGLEGGARALPHFADCI